MQSHSLEMELDCFGYKSMDLIARLADRNAAGQTGNVGSIAFWPLLNNDGVPHQAP
jgi:hypothetical protein